MEKLLLIIIFGIGAGLSIKYHRVVLPALFAALSPSMALAIQTRERTPKYFTELKEEEVTLLIPEYDPTEDLKVAPIKLRYKGR